MAGWQKGGWDGGYGGYYEEHWPEDDEEKFSKTQANVDKVVIMLGIVIAGGLVGPLVAPTGWNEKSTHIWTLYFGLNSITTKLDTIAGQVFVGMDTLRKSSIDSGNAVSLVKLMNPQEPHSVQKMRDEFCNAQIWTFGEIGNCCLIFSYLLYASWACQLGHLAAISFILFATMLMCMKPKKCSRYSALLCYMIAFFAHAGSLFGYVFASMYLKDLFVDVGLANGEFTLSFCALISAMLALFALSLPFLVYFLGRCPKWASVPPPDEYDMYGAPGGDVYGSPQAPPGGNMYGEGWDDGKGGGKQQQPPQQFSQPQVPQQQQFGGMPQQQ